MARKVASFRLDTGLLAEIGVYAESRGASQGQVVEAACREFLDSAKSGVPDLPVADSPEVKQQRVQAVKPQGPLSETQKAEQEFRAAIWARQARLNEEKDRASRSKR